MGSTHMCGREFKTVLFCSDTCCRCIYSTPCLCAAPLETSTTTSSAEPQGTTQQPSRSIFIALTVVVALVLLLAAAVVAVIIVMAVKLRQRKSSECCFEYSVGIYAGKQNGNLLYVRGGGLHAANDLVFPLPPCMLAVMVRSTRYRSGPSLVQSENFDSVQPLIVYNTDSGAPDDDVPAEYTYAWSARKRMRLPTPPFPTTSVPPQVRM